MTQNNTLFKWLLTFSFVCISSLTHTLSSQDLSNKLFSYKEVDIKPTLKLEKSLDFSKWIIGNINHKSISFQDKSFPNNYLIYSDSTPIYHKMDINFTVKTNGKVSDIEIEHTTNPLLEEEVLKIVSQSPKWNVGYHDKRKVNTRIRASLIFELQGNLIKLDQSPLYDKGNTRNNSGKGADISNYIHTIATSLQQFYQRDAINKKDTNNRISGQLEISFTIDKNGQFDIIEEKENLTAVDYAIFHKTQLQSGGLFNKETKWEPATINGEPTGIKIVAIIDYDQQIYGWDGYILKK